jgi:MoaA/NifB/PqqE/SkfB family radical SAM enzyme
MLADGIRVREEKSQSIACLKAHLESKPRAVKIELSSLCNFRCKMCSNAKSRVRQLMSDDDFTVALAQLEQLHPSEIGALFLGESTLHPKLPEMLRKLKCCTDYVFLTTNGLLVDRLLAQKLLLSGLDSLKWSVNW